MTEPTDERSEQAFRRALAARAGEVDVRDLDVPHGRSRRTGLVAGLAAAAAVVAVVVPTVLLAGDGGKEPSDALATEPAAGMRWAGYRDIEVQVPEGWGYDYSPGRPDCIAAGQTDLPSDVPTAPYVEIEQLNRVTTAQGCMPDPAVRGPEQFGQLPVALWQPYVKFSDTDALGAANGEWEHDGWTLTVKTVDDVRISVLNGPQGEADLTDKVFDSVRRVDVDANGCETTSPVQAAQFSRPDDTVVPAAMDVDAIAVCKYERSSESGPGLVGARRIEGDDARQLVEAIRTAPEASGPDSPEDCLPDSLGMEGLVLRFLDADGEAIGEAYVYYDSCFGNGIFDAKAEHALTEGDCKPLFAAPPVSLMSAAQDVFDACASSPN